MENLEFELGYGKSFTPATYKQMKFIESFENFNYSSVISTTQLLKRLEMSEASEIIDALKEGKKVTLNVG